MNIRRAAVEPDVQKKGAASPPVSASIVTPSRNLTPASVLALQRTVGNQAVAGIMRQVASAPAPPPRDRQRVLNRSDAGEHSRTIATIQVIGHASPRWRTATDAQDADAHNRALAESRAEEVGLEVELILADLLPDHQLVFEHLHETRVHDPDALTDQADVTLDVTGRGSSETLLDAGPRGRKANDDPMRRVEVHVTLRSATETLVTRIPSTLSGSRAPPRTGRLQCRRRLAGVLA